ncbi:extracellular solute-binding protein [Brachybacterium alimentarium]|nr:extracellular solute-binding protein [Brachybacterium alimentarium]
MLRASGRSLSRRQFGTLGAAAGATALPGCSASSPKDMDTLQVWGGVPAENGPQAVIDRFQEEHPGTHVTYTPYVNDDRGNLKVNTALQGGVDIDVFFTYGVPNLAMRVDSGLAADVGDLVRAAPELEMFLDTEDPKAMIDGDEITALATRSRRSRRRAFRRWCCSTRTSGSARGSSSPRSGHSRSTSRPFARSPTTGSTAPMCSPISPASSSDRTTGSPLRATPTSPTRRSCSTSTWPRS